MKGRDTVKRVLKALFVLLQCLFIAISLFISAIVIILYSKLKDYLMISIKPVVGTVFISCLYLGVPLFGLLFIMKKRKTFIYIYDILLILLMNLDILIVAMEYLIIKNTVAYTNKRWDNLKKAQKMHVQMKLECCGFFNKKDRAEKTGCKNNNVGCKDVFIGIVEGVRKKLTRFLISCFMIKSLALGIGAILNNKRKRKKLRVKYNKSSHRLEIK